MYNVHVINLCSEWDKFRVALIIELVQDSHVLAVAE